MSTTTTIIPILGAQYFANPKDVTASLTEAEKEVRTIDLLTKVQTMGGMVMLIPEPSNQHNPNAVLARHRGVSVGYVNDDYLEVVHRALKQNAGRPLLAAITEVKVYKHGYLHVALPNVMAASVEPVLYEVDWSMWIADIPLLPTSEAEYCQTEAEMMLGITPFSKDSHPQLSFNLDLWLRGSVNDLSREARESRSHYIELLEASSDAEVRMLAEEVKHQRNAICGERMMTERTGTWWQTLKSSSDLQDLWQKWQLRCKRRYWQNLQMIDDMLRGLPGEVYNDIGDLGKFLSRLYYLNVPRMAYYSILTLMLIREQTCEKLGIPNLPLTTDDYLSDDVIQDMEQMPVTIGQILHYGQTQCELPVQRATIQMLANWLRDEYTHSHCKMADALTQRDNTLQQQTEAMKQATEAMKELASRPTTQNHFAKDSCRFEGGSTMNGNVHICNDDDTSVAYDTLCYDNNDKE